MAKIIGTPYLPKAFPVMDEQVAKNLLPRKISTCRSIRYNRGD